MKFTYGSDFEVFLRRKDKKIVPICGLLGGTKQDPLPFPEAPAGFMYQEDGVTAEFNTPVSDRPADLCFNIRQALDLGLELVAKKIGPGYGLHLASAAYFDREQLVQHPQAMNIGCDPDFSARDNGAPREVPDITAFGEQRFAGFHIHVGYDRDLIPPWMVALSLEKYIHSVPSPECIQRQAFYPGYVFRPKPYGVEYRGLGSYMLNRLVHVQEALQQWERDMQADYGRVLDDSLASNQERIRQRVVRIPAARHFIQAGGARLNFAFPPPEEGMELREEN